MYWSAAERQLSLDGQPVRKLGDYLGMLRAVVFCTEDLQLVKGVGPPAAALHGFAPGPDPRRLSAPPATLRRRPALAQRPARTACPRPRRLEGFTRELIEAGSRVMKFRRELLPRLAALAREACARVAGSAEPLELEYQPSVKHDFAVELARNRARERVFRSTIIGPHRDELQLRLDGKSAAKFASEGQKRSIAIALKLAQAEYLAGVHGVAADFVD